MKIKHKDFSGKTISSINTDCINMVVFHFTDGSSVTLETECIMPTLNLYGIVQVADGDSQPVITEEQFADARAATKYEEETTLTYPPFEPEDFVFEDND